MATSVSVSVVIPCYNEERYIGPLLDDLTKQTVHPKQVIVADSRSTDRTVEVAKGYAEKLPLTVTTSTIRTPGAARNAGARLATGDYIAFIDADDRLPTETIEQLIKATEDGQIDYVSPLFTTPGHHPFDQLILKILNRSLLNPAATRPFVPGFGMCMVVRRSAHKAIHGFNDQLAQENDMEYLGRLYKLGVSHSVAPGLYIDTSNRRPAKDGRIVTLLNMTPVDSWRGKHIIYPLLRSLGKDKRYGIF